jgi:hypothetical protein
MNSPSSIPALFYLSLNPSPRGEGLNYMIIFFLLGLLKKSKSINRKGIKGPDSYRDM